MSLARFVAPHVTPFYPDAHFSTQNDATNYNYGKKAYWNGKYEVALLYLQQAHYFFRQEPKETHLSHYHIGKCHFALGHFDLALQAHELALKVWREAVEWERYYTNEPTSADCFVASALYNIGLCWQAKGNYKRAKEYLFDEPREPEAGEYEKLYDVRELFKRLLPGANDELIAALKLVRSTLEKDSSITPAFHGYMVQGLDFLLKKYGRDQIEDYKMREFVDIASCLNERGLLLVSLGEHQEALENHKMALSAQKEVLGETHPKLIPTLNHMGNCLVALGQFSKALTILERAFGKHFISMLQEQQSGLLDVSSIESLLTDTHGSNLHLADTLSNVGVCLYSMGRYEKALRVHEIALQMRIKAYGQSHPSVAESYGHIGNCHSSMRNLEKASVFLEKALDIRKAFYGDDHPLVAISLIWLGSNLSFMEQYNESLQIYSKAQQILETLEGELIQQHLLWAKSCVHFLSSLIKVKEISATSSVDASSSEIAEITAQLDPQVIISYVKEYLGQTLTEFQKNPSGFVRAHIPMAQHLPLSNKIAHLRVHYWPQGEQPIDFIEAAHSHPRPFISIIVQGGYEHEICEIRPTNPDAVSEDCRVYRVLKNEQDKHVDRRDLLALGRIFLNVQETQRVKEGDIVGFPLSLIHRVKEYKKGTLTINLVLTNKEDSPPYFDIYTSGNVDPQLGRESLYSGKTAEMAGRIISILDAKLGKAEKVAKITSLIGAL